MMRARIATAGRIDRPLVFGISGVLDIETAETREQLSVPGVSGGHDAVEHVDAPCDTLDQVLGRPRTHQISRRRGRQPRARFLDDLIHLVYGLADAQAAEGVALEAD